MRKRIVMIGACALVLVAVGSSPRYLEELRIGGGYGEAVDGGADLEADGDIWSDGVIGAVGSNTETLTAGVSGLHRGVVTAWHGAGGSAPGCVKLGSSDGTARYLFASSAKNGLRLHDSLPGSDEDGIFIGKTDLGDDEYRRFGDDGDFRLGYQSNPGMLMLKDSDGNFMAAWSDVGSTVNMAVYGGLTAGTDVTATNSLLAGNSVQAANSVASSLGWFATLTLSGDAAVNGGDLTCSSPTFNLVNDTVTTLNVGGAADVNVGGSTKTATVNGYLGVENSVDAEDVSAKIGGELVVGNASLSASCTWAVPQYNPAAQIYTQLETIGAVLKITFTITNNGGCTTWNVGVRDEEGNATSLGTPTASTTYYYTTVDRMYTVYCKPWSGPCDENTDVTIEAQTGYLKVEGNAVFLGQFVQLPVRTATGDPASAQDGWMYVNTQDNKVRVYADGAWRDLATW